MGSFERATALAARMHMPLRNIIDTSSTIDAKGTASVHGSFTVFGTELGRLVLTVLTSKAHTKLIRFVAVTLEFHLVRFGTDPGLALGAVHTGMGSPGAKIETKLTLETDIANRTNTIKTQAKIY